MVRHNWKKVGTTQYANIYVDYARKKTKIETTKYVYVHEGVYPFHNYDAVKRYKK